MKDKYIDKDTIVTGIYCKKCKKSFSVKAFDHLGMNKEKVAYGCPTCQDHIRPHKSWLANPVPYETDDYKIIG